jgi:hypothetical protein
MLVMRTGSGIRATDPDPGWIKFLIVQERVVLSKGGSWRMKVFYVPGRSNEFLNNTNECSRSVTFWYGSGSQICTGTSD